MKQFDFSNIEHKIWLACVNTSQRIRKIFTCEERKAIREALQDY